MAKKLLLTSSGLDNQLLVDAFLQMLPKAPNECTVAFIPTAGNTVVDQQHIRNRLSELRSIDIHTVRILDIEGMDKSSVREQLRDSDIVFVNGGNTFRLLHWARQSGFCRVMNELLEHGVVYVGVSAGSYLACPTIEAAGWKHGDTNTEKLADLAAINAVPFLVTAHYDESKVDEVSDGAVNTTLAIVALRDGQAIQVIGDKVTFIGEGEPIAFNGFVEQYLSR